MATLQKFKLLAMQCGVVQSPTRSPRTSPLVQFQRRKTTSLRMFLCRSTSSRTPRRKETTLQLKHVLDSRDEEEEENNGKDIMRRSSLKQLFVSSIPHEEDMKEIEKVTIQCGREFGSFVGSGHGIGSPKPGWMRFRYRSLLLRKSWRPALITIPE